MTTRSGLKFTMMFAVSVGLATLSSSAHALGISAASANGVGCVAITNGGGNGVGAPGGTSVDFTLTVNETVTCLQWDIVLTVTGPPKTLSADELGLTKNILNNSGIDWIDFHMILGTGTGGAFVQSNIEGLFFRASFPSPGSNIFANASTNGTNQVDYDGGLVANGATVQITAGISIPDSMFDPAIFTVRQVATIAVVPEPSTILLLASGLAALAVGRRRLR